MCVFLHSNPATFSRRQALCSFAQQEPVWVRVPLLWCLALPCLFFASRNVQNGAQLWARNRDRVCGFQPKVNTPDSRSHTYLPHTWISPRCGTAWPWAPAVRYCQFTQEAEKWFREHVFCWCLWKCWSSVCDCLQPVQVGTVGAQGDLVLLLHRALIPPVLSSRAFQSWVHLFINAPSQHGWRVGIPLHPCKAS